MDSKIKSTLTNIARSKESITVLTGAGISAESGIPTFRGPEGYWTVGSKEYHPQEMATLEMFQKDPKEVWKWYLYRMGICRRAQPNAGHRAIVNMEKLFGDRLTLITQNVDNLHLRAGNSPNRTYQIHGNIFFIRCAAECSATVYPLPSEVVPKDKGEELTDADRQKLTCPQCSRWARPHVLWFDETYNEAHYRFYSSLTAAQQTALLLIVGTSGATNLPNQVAWEVHQHGGVIIDINIEKNSFSKLALSSQRGFFIQSTSSQALEEIVHIFYEALNP